jgi:hypothetical protein
VVFAKVFSVAASATALDDAMMRWWFRDKVDWRGFHTVKEKTDARDAVGLARSLPRPVRIERDGSDAGNRDLTLHWARIRRQMGLSRRWMEEEEKLSLTLNCLMEARARTSTSAVARTRK